MLNLQIKIYRESKYASTMKETESENLKNVYSVDVRPLEPIESKYLQNENGIFSENGLKAGLKNRMVNMIALCGIVGPGCFIGM